MSEISIINHSSNGVQMSVVIHDQTKDLQKKLLQGYYRGLKKIGMRAVTYAKRLCPVDTGRLRNSITSYVSGDDVFIGSNVEYAKYVECGTGQQSLVGGNPLLRGMKPRPFLRPAATEHGKEYGEILKEEVNKG